MADQSIELTAYDPNWQARFPAPAFGGANERSIHQLQDTTGRRMFFRREPLLDIGDPKLKL
jgi:hypothetical protein